MRGKSSLGQFALVIQSAQGYASLELSRGCVYITSDKNLISNRNRYADQVMLLAVLLIFVGSFVQTAIGFGLAIVSAPLLIIIAPEYVPAPICLVALFISILNALKHKSSVEIGGLKMALIGRVPGRLLAVFYWFWFPPMYLLCGLAY